MGGKSDRDKRRKQARKEEESRAAISRDLPFSPSPLVKSSGWSALSRRSAEGELVVSGFFEGDHPCGVLRVVALSEHAAELLGVWEFEGDVGGGRRQQGDRRGSELSQRGEVEGVGGGISRKTKTRKSLLLTGGSGGSAVSGLPPVSYEGDTNAEGEREGKGKLLVREQCVYEGSWRGGLPEGHGKHFCLNGEGGYVGEMKRGMRHGKGAFFWRDQQIPNQNDPGKRAARVYEGRWLFDKQCDVEASYTDEYGRTRKADFLEGEILEERGEGASHRRLQSPCPKSSFLQDFIDSVGPESKDGRLAVRAQNTMGGRREDVVKAWELAGAMDSRGGGGGSDGGPGAALGGQTRSQGTIVYFDKTRYTGALRKGMRDGKGEVTNEKGEVIFSGEFANDRILKTDQFKDPDGMSYEGQRDSATGMRQGKGRLVVGGSLLYEGEWAEDRPDGFGVHRLTSGEGVYAGEFRRGKRHGLGFFFWNDDWLKKERQEQDERNGPRGSRDPPQADSEQRERKEKERETKKDSRLRDLQGRSLLSKGGDGVTSLRAYFGLWVSDKAHDSHALFVDLQAETERRAGRFEVRDGRLHLPAQVLPQAAAARGQLKKKRDEEAGGGRGTGRGRVGIVEGGESRQGGAGSPSSSPALLVGPSSGFLTDAMTGTKEVSFSGRLDFELLLRLIGASADGWGRVRDQHRGFDAESLLGSHSDDFAAAAVAGDPSASALLSLSPSSVRRPQAPHTHSQTEKRRRTEPGRAATAEGGGQNNRTGASVLPWGSLGSGGEPQPESHQQRGEGEVLVPLSARRGSTSGGGGALGPLSLSLFPAAGGAEAAEGPSTAREVIRERR